MSPVESTPPSKSTGPRTSAGKAIASMNAMRHGLTGRVVVLPTEDMNAYNAFCKELMADLAPETAVERQYAQTFCDTQWRLNRARSYEDSMLALAHFEGATIPGVDHPEIENALIAAKVFRENSRAFVNLSLYEQRLQRAQKEALRQLEELQTRRRAAKQAELQAAEAATEAGRNAHKMKAQPSGPGAGQFVYSTAEIERELSRHILQQSPRPAAKNNESPLRDAA